MRKAQNRNNVSDMVCKLDNKCKEMTKQNVMLKTRISTFQDPDEECGICMEAMQGTASMKCGHQMCISCFAQHARLNNTCPFCRDEFVDSKPLKPDVPSLDLGTSYSALRTLSHNEIIDMINNDFDQGGATNPNNMVNAFVEFFHEQEQAQERGGRIAIRRVVEFAYGLSDTAVTLTEAEEEEAYAAILQLDEGGADNQNNFINSMAELVRNENVHIGQRAIIIFVLKYACGIAT
jgi:hypothetical protein